MKLYTNKDATGSTAGFYLLLDNDFLSEVFRDEEVLNEFLTIFQNSYYLIDPLIEFEFLRDVYEPKQRRIKEAFISKSIFSPIANRQEIFIKIQANAMVLSKIYSHKGHTKNTKMSLVDLFLGARCMMHASSTMIITGNKKDFPNSVFDIVAVINIEQNDGNIKPYTILKFNKAKFEKCHEAMQKMEEAYDKSIQSESH